MAPSLLRVPFPPPHDIPARVYIATGLLARALRACCSYAIRRPHTCPGDASDAERIVSVQPLGVGSHGELARSVPARFRCQASGCTWMGCMHHDTRLLLLHKLTLPVPARTGTACHDLFQVARDDRQACPRGCAQQHRRAPQEAHEPWLPKAASHRCRERTHGRSNAWATGLLRSAPIPAVPSTSKRTVMDEIKHLWSHAAARVDSHACVCLHCSSISSAAVDARSGSTCSGPPVTLPAAFETNSPVIPSFA